MSDGRSNWIANPSIPKILSASAVLLLWLKNGWWCLRNIIYGKSAAGVDEEVECQAPPVTGGGVLHRLLGSLHPFPDGKLLRFVRG